VDSETLTPPRAAILHADPQATLELQSCANGANDGLNEQFRLSFCQAPRRCRKGHHADPDSRFE